jgi:hypothetical protein
MQKATSFTLSNNWYLSILIFGLVICLTQASSRAEECGCRFQKARSEATAGACAVREDMARDCDLVWGPTAGAKEVGAKPPENNSLINDLTRAATAGQSPDADKVVPGASRMSDSAFWDQFKNEVRHRSQLPDDPRTNTFDHALAFLANAGAVSDFHQYALAAVIFVAATNLSQGQIDPELRLTILFAMMRNRDKLTTFVSSASDFSKFNDVFPVKTPGVPDGKVAINGQISRGCVDIWTQEPPISSLVKAPWSSAKGRRCE